MGYLFHRDTKYRSETLRERTLMDKALDHLKQAEDALLQGQTVLAKYMEADPSDIDEVAQYELLLPHATLARAHAHIAGVYLLAMGMIKEDPIVFGAEYRQQQWLDQLGID